MTNPTRKKTGSNKPIKGTAQKKAPAAAPGDIPVTRQAAQQSLAGSTWLMGSIFILVICILASVAYLQQTKTELIGTTSDGRIFRPELMTSSILTDPQVLSFVDKCLQESFAHDFQNFQRTMNRVKADCYTPDGGSQGFEAAMEDHLKLMKSKRLVMNAVTRPTIMYQSARIKNGRVTWNAQTVMTVYYSGTQHNFTPQTRIAYVEVVRVPASVNPKQIGIESIRLAPCTGQVAACSAQ